MKLKLTIAAIALLSLVSCTKEAEDAQAPDRSGLVKVTVTASYGDAADTKTIINDDNSVLWSPSEVILLWDGQTYYPFTSTNKEPAAVAEFTGSVNPETYGKDNVWYYGPYLIDPQWHPSVEKIQTLTGKSHFPMAAKSDGSNLVFYNICGGLKFRVATEGITKVTFRSNLNETMSGAMDVSFDDNRKPFVEKCYAGDFPEVSLSAPDGFEVGKWYHISIFPAELSKGYTITYYKGEYAASVRKDTPITVKPGVLGTIDSADKNLTFEYAAKALLPSTFIPKGITKADITAINFITNSDVTTETVISEEDEEYKAIYLQQDGTVLNYYTKAAKYEARILNPGFMSCSSLKTLDLRSFDTHLCETMSNLFRDCTSLESIDLSSFDTGGTTQMFCMFRNCESLKSLNISSFNTDNVVDMSSMFQGCKLLKGLDISKFSTGKVKNFSDMFRDCSSLTALDFSSFDTSAGITFASMFDGCSSLTELDLSSFHTPEATRMDDMFHNCSGIKTLNIQNFDVSKTTSTGSMFQNVSSIETLDLSSFGESKVLTVASMFRGCSSLKSLDLRNFSTPELTSANYMFGECSSLTGLKIDKMITDKVESMYCMFDGCSSLTYLDLSHFKTPKVEELSYMFQNCTSLTGVNLKNFNTEKVKNMGHMFAAKGDGSGGKYSVPMALKTLDLSMFKTPKLTSTDSMFLGCENLESLDISNFTPTSSTYVLGTFENLAKISGKCSITCLRDSRLRYEKDSATPSERIKWIYSDPVSSDYSADGKIIMLQEATSPSAIPLVFMGDGYSDKMIADGTYHNDMVKAMENFFDIEPYKTFRNYFDVYEIDVVSKYGFCEESAFSTTYDGTRVSGDEEVAYLHLPTDLYSIGKTIEITTVAVIVNMKVNGSSTVSYEPTEKKAYPNGYSVCFVPLGTSDDFFHDMIQQEVGGRGFMKFGYEYIKSDDTVPSDYVAEMKRLNSNYHWFGNIAYSSDKSAYDWKWLTENSDYDDELLDLYIGGEGYRYGLWHPSGASIMNNLGSIPKFNAYCRWMIWDKVNRLSGNAFSGDLEDFYEYDKINLPSSK